MYVARIERSLSRAFRQVGCVRYLGLGVLGQGLAVAAAELRSRRRGVLGSVGSGEFDLENQMVVPLKRRKKQNC